MASTSGKVSSSAGGYMAYLKDEERTLARERSEGALGYYEEGSGGPDEVAFETVIGNLAPELGLELGITRGQWEDLFEHQWQGDQLTRTSYRKVTDKETGEVTVELGAKTPMIDVVFAAPKGVSELYARAATQADADAIGRVVFEAAKQAWTEGVQGYARATRVKGQRVTADMLCTPVLQYTARPTDLSTARPSGASDPHLHVHCPTFSAVQVNGKWYTLDEAGIKRTAEFRDQIFMGEVARGLEHLGYRMNYTDFETSRSGRITFEPEASTREFRDEFSTNSVRARILTLQYEMEHEGRTPDFAQLNKMMKATRGAKADKEMDSRPTRERWISDGEAAGLAVHPIEAGKPIEPPLDRHQILWNRLMGDKGLCRADATFTGDQIRPAIALSAIGLGFSRPELIDLEPGLIAQLEVLKPAHEDRFRLYTTKEQLRIEGFVDDTLNQKASTQLEPVPMEVIEQAIMAQGITLTQEQRNIVTAACSSSNLFHLQGLAGTGKSTVTKTVIDAYKLAGLIDQAVVVSTAAKAAQDAGQKMEADKWGSVESIKAQIETGKLRIDSRTLVILEEVAMMSTRGVYKIFEADTGARVMTIGDTAQLAPIGAAGWLQPSLDRHGFEQLTEVRRQQDHRDIRDYNLIRNGKAERALDNMAMRDRVHQADNKDERLIRVEQDYKLYRDVFGYTSEQIRQITDMSNHDVDRMNRMVQRDRHEREELSRRGFEVEDVEQNRHWTLHENDQIIFLRSHMADGTPVKNGSTGVIKWLDHVTGKARIQVGEKLLSINLNASEQTQPVGLAYAQHANKMQGGEVEIIQSLPGATYNANANSIYSQLTRAKHEAHLYLDHETHGEDALGNYAKACSVPFEKRSATWHQMQSVVREAEGIVLKSEGRFNTSGAQVHPVNRFADDELRARADAHADYIAETFSEDLARRVANSSAYPALVIKLEELAAQGNDAHAMLADAITDRELATADDVAAGISYRLDSTPEVEDPGLHLNVATGYVDNFEFSYDYSEGDYEFTEDSYSVQRGVKGRGMSL